MEGTQDQGQAPAQTVFAAQAVDFAEKFTSVMSHYSMGGRVQYKVDMSAPEGMSTGAGTQSRQHIKLVPVTGYGTLVIGAADKTTGIATLRKWEQVQAACKARFHEEPPFSREDYQSLLEAIDNYFTAVQVKVNMEPFVRPARAETEQTFSAVPATTKTSGFPMFQAIGGAALFAAGLLVGWLFL